VGDTSPLLEVARLTKRFPGVVALENVDLHLNPNEVLAVIGENGAGKSTLMKILAGIQPPDDGLIRIDGAERQIDSVRTATDLGIALIHQELILADNLDVAANIYLGRESGRYGWIPKKELAKKTQKILDELEVGFSPVTPVAQLSIGHCQLVEIGKALSTNARIIIMDEPTSSLSQKETQNLFRIIEKLRNKGVSVIYISHRLAEVSHLADRVVVLKDGRNAGELSREEATHDAMVSLMVGRDVDRTRHRAPHEPGDVVLKLVNVETPAHPGKTLSLELREREVVGLAGLVGAGRTELLETLFGITPALSGTIEAGGGVREIRSPKSAIDAGLGLVPEDRKKQGLILEMAVRENVTMASLDRHQKGGFISATEESNTTEKSIKKLNIKTPTDAFEVQLLSGGNQQKVVIGKWLAVQPRVLLLDEPTRGIDVGAKAEIYQLMDRLAADGVAILFVSSEMEEVLTLADRLYVMHEGEITGELSHTEIEEETIMKLATGNRLPAEV
jgi:ribose transport system ATP-binding protein